MCQSAGAVSPSTGYEILDIRTPEKGTIRLQKSHKPTMAVSSFSDITGRPPSPPPSTDPSVDAFNNADLGNTILDCLNQPPHCKSIPTYVLYDTRGLQLFDQITHLDEYYLTNAEMDILVERADQLADRVREGSILIELGSGSLRKTLITLQAIERKKIHVTYYALDLDQHELERSLASLGEFTYVDLVGLLGTYDQGIPWLSQRFASNTKTHKIVLWLGSSIGNQTRKESAKFLHRLQRTCLQPGDLCVIGFDKRNDANKIEAAYDDSLGVTREFIMNGLDHVNVIMGQPLLDRSLFDYDSRYQVKEGRHLSHYRAKQDMVLTYEKPNETVRIPVQKDELIHVEHSYKYSLKELTSILNAAELDILETWTDSKDSYRLVVAECRPFLFHRDKRGTIDTLFPTSEELLCHHCGSTNDDIDMETKSVSATCSLVNITGSKDWPEIVPSLNEWQQLWCSWDVVTQSVLDPYTMTFERPIDLRHPFIFYLGHIPGFADIQLFKHGVGVQGDGEVLAPFATMFERGMDPDMDDPTKCHDHSVVPTRNEDWPSIESIRVYQETIRNRIQRLLLQWEAEGYDASEWMTLPGRRRQCRVLWLLFEHEVMHLETLLYMLMQSPNVRPPQDVSPPAWKMAVNDGGKDSKVYGKLVKAHDRCLDASPTFTVSAGTVKLGHDDDEDRDDCGDQVQFGWDNERPARQAHVGSFKIQQRPVTNGEYFAYLQASDKINSSFPSSWARIDSETIGVRTVFGLCPLAYAMHWPVQVSYNEAEQYANHYGMRLPTEPEFLLFRDTYKGKTKIPNIGFKNWHPTEVDNTQASILGDVWEWTATFLERHPGYKPSVLYPGYSQDFFDGKHRVVLGGSWATHPRLAERSTVRNWYQSGYPYVFAGFRCCTSST
ncbi:hypothetical protein EC973_008599 [Apophysomyces ossiformis]|uniref:Uncharacterized protein n=1 Tax=Apophysomyces ossiformis TaxID=679940 RepID=A0A8H7BWS2_9FUNG|nr:hypothetical protein EC973_008599 [Apophysomyces ossiformis]